MNSRLRGNDTARAATANMHRMNTSTKLAFVGGGNMAGALIDCILHAGLTPQEIVVIEPVQTLREAFAARSITAHAAAHADLRGCDVWFLAVKPQSMREVCGQIAPHLPADTLVISIAAGLPLASIQRWLKSDGKGGHAKLARAMPNTPAKVGLGITGLYALPGCDGNDISAVQSLFEAAGKTVWLHQEGMLDAITAISGSGPGYVFYFMEAMQQAARELGFDAASARDLAVATFQGAAALAAASPEELATLRERVTSKGGTTYAALSHMQAAGVDAAIVQALHAANARAKEFAEQLSRE
jgi:pyrroline-5-carboxylate reductase